MKKKIIIITALIAIFFAFAGLTRILSDEGSGSYQYDKILIVQGFDLGLLLPVCFVVALQLRKGKKDGYIYGTTYIVFLSILMTALSAKIIAMQVNGVNTIPSIFIIPLINLISIFCTWLMIKNVKNLSEFKN